MTTERNMRYRRWYRYMRREIAHRRDYHARFRLSGKLTAGSDFYRREYELAGWTRVGQPSILGSLGAAVIPARRRCRRPRSPR